LEGQTFFTIRWEEGQVVMLDQLLLPGKEEYLRLDSAEEVAEAIRRMNIRGAPAIGVAAAMGIALGLQGAGEDPAALRSRFEQVCRFMGETRPTAVNLFWAIERMTRIFESVADQPADRIRSALRDESQRILDEDVASCRRMGALGARYVRDGANILTHCNAGALATGGYGTALGVVRAAHQEGKRIHVFADETRPYLQGARLTAWELQKDGIPVTLITDNMAGHFMQKGRVDLVVVGADRIAANGDAANKIGTYPLSVLAREHGIPFYVAAPLSTVDMNLASGQDIPIEERGAEEVVIVGGTRIAPEGVDAAHPAFDVTPAANITAIITDAGIAGPPSAQALQKLFMEGGN